MELNSELIDFFKKHNLYDEKIFYYLSNNTTMIDYNDKDKRSFIGCFYNLEKGNKIKNIHLVLPYVIDDITMLISIHEIVHAIVLYRYINKKAKIGIDVEVLPMFYEKIYINEHNSSELIKYEEQLNSFINISKDRKYILGLQLRDKLLVDYDDDINKNYRKLKKLVKSNMEL